MIRGPDAHSRSWTERDTAVREVDLMHATYWDVFLILGLILASGLLATSEVAIGSARKSRLRDWSNRGYRGAGLALELSEDAQTMLWKVQSGMTLLGSLAGVYAGVTLAPRLIRAIEKVGPLAPYGQPLAVGMIVLAITSASLVLAELAPRRIALVRPERIARALSRPVRVLAIIAVPLVGILSGATDRVLRLVGVRPRSEPPITQEEISVLLQQGTKAGVLEEGEHEMIKRVFRFSDRRARALMTPRNDVVWIDQADPPDEIRRKIVSSPHTRFPVCDQSLDNLLGIVQVKDLLVQDQNADPFRIKGRLTLPLFLYEGTRGLRILEMFKTSGSRLAVVLDEYGTVAGLLTLTNILEALVGDMPVADEEDEPAMVERQDGSWLLDGRLPLDEFRDLFELTSVQEGDFHTLAGLVVTQLRHIPRVGETFDNWGLHFEVVDMDGNRVDRILVARATKDHSPS
jgi:putative hemolysin